MFTAWAFVFNFPDLCDGPCDGNDLGDTPAQGGVYNVDGQVIWRDTLELGGHIKRNQGSLNGGVSLSNPKGAEVHIAIAPHGEAIRELIDVQTTSPAGSPACGCWWVATILPGGGGGLHG